jgi:hypothetical protein
MGAPVCGIPEPLGRIVCRIMASADVMAITKWSI